MDFNKFYYQGGKNYGNGDYKQLQQLCGTEQCGRQHEKEGNRKHIRNSRGAASQEAHRIMDELAKLVPSVELKVGNSFSTAKSGKTLTINPQLLEKMQNDPEKEKK